MNQRGLISFLLLTSFLSFAPLYAADEVVAESAAAPVKKRTEAEEKKILEKRKRVADKKTDLNGSSWDVVYTTTSDPKQKGKKDLLTFQNGQFNSKSLMDRGFTWTNYTISVPDEASEMAVWETMQTGKEGIVFVHGEWIKDKMSGSVTEQLDGGKKVIQHSFSTVNRVAIPPSTEESESAAQGTLVASTASETPQEASGVLVSKEVDTVALPVDEVNKKIDILAKSALADKMPAVKKPAVAAFEPGTTEEKI